jgi:hypothetical protein
MIALRQGKESQPKIAMEAKLALAKTATTLSVLARRGLAKHDHAKRWHATVRGTICLVRQFGDLIGIGPKRCGKTVGT